MVLIIGSLDSICLFGISDVYMLIILMFYVYVWGILYVVIMFGVKQVYFGCYDLELLVELWKCEKVIFFYCVLIILQMVMNVRVVQGVDFKGWKVIIGGSVLNCLFYEVVKVCGIQLIVVYGMLEICLLIFCVYFNDELLVGSEDECIIYWIKVGVLVLLVDVVIMDEQGCFFLVDGEFQGELVLCLLWLIQGYFCEFECGEELWCGGWMYIGDVVILDGMGFIEICDCIKDVIKIGGEWLFFLELEDLISCYLVVCEVVVVGVFDL